MALSTVVVLQGLDPARANHDVAWTLHAGAELAAGSEYGVDVIELNLPLILWLTAPLAGLVRAAGLPLVATYNLAVLAAIILASFAAARLLRPVFPNAHLRGHLALALATVSTLLPRYAYGQRDHLIFLGLLPIVLLAAHREDDADLPSSRARVAVGLAAAAAIAIKPHFAVVWLVALLFYAWRSGNPRLALRLENRVVVVACAAYALAIVLFAPSYFEVMRDAIDLYGAYDGPTALLSFETLPLLTALALVAWLRSRGLGRGRRGDVILGSLIASIVSLGVVIAQGKGYAYHHLPSELFASFAMLCLLFDWIETRPQTQRARALRVGELALALLVVIALVLPATPYPEHRAIARLIEEQGRSEPVLFLSTTVNPAFPVLAMTGNAWPLPWPSVWWIPGHYPRSAFAGGPFPYRRVQAMSEREREYAQRVVESIVQDAPRLILIDRRASKFPFRRTEFSLERYFGEIPGFSEAMTRYRPLGQVGGFAISIRR